MPCTETYTPSPAISTRDGVRFSSAGLSDLDLPSPTFGNTQTLDWKIITHTNSSGAIITAQPSWKTRIYKLTMTFRALTEAQKDNSITFLQGSAGQSVTYIDYENRTWVGCITTKNPVFTMSGRGCQYQFSIEFTGNLS